MQQNQERKDTSSDKPFQSNTPNRDDTGNVREGQEDSSILHDKKDPDKELSGTMEKDISSTSQEEFIDDENTIKEDDR